MKNLIFIFFFWVVLIFPNKVYAQPANDNCASATTLTIDAALTCGQTTQNSTLQGSECYTNYGGGSTESSTWYRITANNDSLILNFIQTNTPNCYPEVSVYGPFASGGGCLPACASTVYNALQNGDPGSHILLTGLATSGNRDYLIQIQNNSCGGPGSGFNTYCINVQQPEGNNTPTGADQLDACGTAFNNSTNGGYWQTGTSAGFNNLDNNNGTTCGGCTAGDDTPFIINNVSWTYFCSLTAGTWQITVNNINGCTLPSPNQGVQASIFTGTTASLVNAGNSQNPIAPGGSWTSGTITVNNGECAYLMIDGFAGDACNYSVTLTNLSGGCVVLPIELEAFSAFDLGNQVRIEWITQSEINNDYFVLEKSNDGENYSFVSEVDAVGSSTSAKTYSYYDSNSFSGMVYYRLKQIDYDGNSRIMGYAKIVRQNDEPISVDIYPNPSNNGSFPNIFLNGKLDENYTYSLIDISGKSIVEGNFKINTESSQQIYLNVNPGAGAYFIKLIDSQGKVLIRKMIIH